jgi:hypothetical protein
LATTNPIESALSVTGRATRWRDADMRRRGCVAGLLRAEGQLRRIKALEVMTRGQPPGSERNLA